MILIILNELGSSSSHKWKNIPDEQVVIPCQLNVMRQANLKKLHFVN